MNYATDIPLETAQAAHAGTSFVPERRAQQERDDYAATLQADYDDLAALATTDDLRATLKDEFSRYRDGYRKRTLAYLRTRSRLVSWMIAGPSRFPVARMQKRSDVTHRRLEELLDYRKRALAAIRRQLQPHLRPIMAGDTDAVERLQEKIDKAERLQAIMAGANKIVRSKPKNEATPEKMAHLIALGLSEQNARRLFEADYLGRLGFPGYELTNNNANIRRMKGRLAAISRAQDTPETSEEGTNATVEIVPAENRVRLTFPGKPSAEVRQRLKSAGFRWAPSLGVWQAYNGQYARHVAREVAGVA